MYGVYLSVLSNRFRELFLFCGILFYIGKIRPEIYANA